MNAVDTNVLVYFVDRNEPIKRQKATELLARLAAGPDPSVLPWQVAIEFVACMKRWENKGLMSGAEVESNWKLA